ncbi:hypothetical protein FALBO_10666 [Fusarium albosuccineum]|uniref:Uncharacterized protein n=1 Tax=Fusarium albosuccineum TaxID=1237068 RepID=A0A8H4L7A9_9HYPO|nr:hypothetical protein FALBO_10666 [Fusarium albosuccineum]
MLVNKECTKQMLASSGQLPLATGKGESDNPILSYAWLGFGNPRDRETQGRIAQAKSALVAALPRADPDAPQDVSFRDLCTSDLMNKSLWCEPLFHMFHPDVLIAPTSETLVQQEPWTGHELVVRSMLHLNLQQIPGLTLQTLVNMSCGKLPGGVLRAPKRPAIIRILYTPGQHLAYKPQVVKACYTLCAMVRLRRVDSERDVVRTYSSNGAPIVPEYETPCMGPSDWSVQDNTLHSFMLFYMLNYNEETSLDYSRLDNPEPVFDRYFEQSMEESLGRFH